MTEQLAINPPVDDEEDVPDNEYITEPTDEDYARLFPNPAAVFVAKLARQHHDEYCDAFVATYPDVPNVRFTTWLKSQTAATSCEADDALSILSNVARLSEDVPTLVYLQNKLTELLDFTKSNLQNLHAQSRHVTPQSARSDDELSTMLTTAEQSVTALLSLIPVAGMGVTEDAVWAILPSKDVKIKGGKGATRRRWSPPKPKRDGSIRANSSSFGLERLSEGEWAAIDGNPDAACKSALNLTFAEVRKMYFDDKFTTQSMGVIFSHNDKVYRFANK